jgi:hypothetical protein
MQFREKEQCELEKKENREMIPRYLAPLVGLGLLDLPFDFSKS